MPLETSATTGHMVGVDILGEGIFLSGSSRRPVGRRRSRGWCSGRWRGFGRFSLLASASGGGEIVEGSRDHVGGLMITLYPGAGVRGRRVSLRCSLCVCACFVFYGLGTILLNRRPLGALQDTTVGFPLWTRGLPTVGVAASTSFFFFFRNGHKGSHTAFPPATSESRQTTPVDIFYGVLRKYQHTHAHDVRRPIESPTAHTQASRPALVATTHSPCQQHKHKRACGNNQWGTVFNCLLFECATMTEQCTPRLSKSEDPRRVGNS